VQKVNGSTQSSLPHSQLSSSSGQSSGIGTQKYSVVKATSSTQPWSGPHSLQSATIVPVSPELSPELADEDEPPLVEPSLPVGPPSLEPPSDSLAVSVALELALVLALLEPSSWLPVAEVCEVPLEGSLAPSSELADPEPTSPGSVGHAVVARAIEKSMG
jgi:hypothetical protein